jgi:hypothetical protein
MTRPTKFQQIGYRAVGDETWRTIRGAWISPDEALLEEQLGRVSTHVATAGRIETLEAKGR